MCVCGGRGWVVGGGVGVRGSGRWRVEQPQGRQNRAATQLGG